MKNILFTLLIIIGFHSPVYSQTSKLNYEIVPANELKDWVENYGFGKLDALAESGDAVAQRRLARYYNYEKNDYYTAVKWYKKGAENGDYYAQSNLGYMYYNGLGVSKDNYKAKEWWMLAIKKMTPDGVESAAVNLALIIGGYQTYVFRAKWYLEDAPRGNKVSQFYLAQFYEKGYGGLPENEMLAKKWYQKSANQGFEPAATELKRIIERQNDSVDVVEVVEDEVEIEETIIESTETNDDEEIAFVQTVDKEIVYKENKEYYYNNKLKAEGHYDKNLKRIGFWKNYSHKGYLASSGYYKNGVRIGKWKLYHPNGKVKAEGSYLGKLDPNKNFEYHLRKGTWHEYTESGKLYKTFYYNNDGEKTGMEWH